ncbi:YihY/virulence factor BrkB family protein [Leptolyngbya boryana CZ1]|uniref:YihY/virulence factor BrkB family protein n=1 Tax=Leptolyngbya boryana CZ1 TaxID=3060204 RepID=A0AA97AV89_LEPBY|nr:MULTISPECIES: YihY/virulence factor BrkB family protein [Leptolyngbya]MBN8559971.1 YihY/virulence factor BrkB family protein [Leptolyngbya sp. UWPOB_LEPTO1]WNZ47230.1 YihY/virulence factor BrkB family protein [Leptolyngbya boryana CZ1]
MLHYLRSNILPSKPAQLLIRTGMKWNHDNCPGMAASLSYFALFSLFPMLLVLLSVIGSWVQPGTEAFQQIQAAGQRFLPPEVHGLVRNTLLALYRNSAGAGIIGFGVLLWTASSVFEILRASVNKIWRSSNRSPESSSVPKIVLFFIVNKLFSFLLMMGAGLLLLSSLITSIAIKAILQLVSTFQATFAFLQIDESQLSQGLQTGSAFFILALATCVLFKILPSVRVAWQDVWLGALLTTAGLVGLQQLVSNSVISLGAAFLSYGVIGSVMILMLWIFLTFQIVLFGCVFTYVYAHLFGSRQGRAIE